MTTSFRLGRVAGVDIGVNWSWLIAVVLIGWVLAAGIFPDRSPGLNDGTYVAMAAVAVVLFFSTLLLHELGHALQARREGMPIDGITLWIFGGVARFEGMFPSAGAEFRIAIAGPIVSLVIGVAFVAVAAALSFTEAVDGVIAWLGYINLVLLAFNMLPALPLDGGRVLRSALWARRQDFLSATWAAATAGRVFGQVLIGLGLLAVILYGALGGLWLAFIGWFLLSAAESEAGVATAQRALEGVKVGDVMIQDPVTADPEIPLSRFMDEVFFAHRHTTYPVADDGRALGLISFRDAANTAREEWLTARVRERMVPVGDVLVVSPGADLSEVMPRLLRSSLRRALVCDEGRLLGLLSITDAARVLEARSGGVAAGRAADSSPPAALARPERPGLKADR